jgi:Tetratricopeptide repeat
MPSPVTDLQQRAIDFAKSGNFGSQALETNLELTRVAPQNEGAWTRLARCYVESGRLDDASAALDAALALNPQNTIARNMQADMTKRRSAATTPAAAARTRSGRTKRSEAAAAGTGGFGRPEFAALGQLPPVSAVEALGTRVDALLLPLNDRPFAIKAVETRNRTGRPGGWVFRRNSVQPGSAGHIYTFHYGGRWEPQLNVGFFAAQPWGRNAVRAGVGFNLTPAGADPNPETGQERAVQFFDHFQRLVSTEWRQILTQWMEVNGGFIQHGARPPETDLMPAAAIEWLAKCQNPVDAGWVFLGRWLFEDRAADADILADGRKLTGWIERTFTDLLPLWATLYRQS